MKCLTLGSLREHGYRFNLKFVLRGLSYFPKLQRARRLRLGFSQRSEVLAYQKKRLARLLDHADRTVPFYQERLASLRLKYKDWAQCPLEEIPPLLRRDVIEAKDRIFSSRGGPVIRHFSSGTTGEPLRVYYDLYRRHYTAGLVRHHLEKYWPQLGIRFRPLKTTMAYLWLLSKENSRADLNPTNHAERAATLLPAMNFAKHYVLQFSEEEASLAEALEIMSQKPPDILLGEPAVLFLYYSYLKARGHVRHPPRVRVLLSTGSQLVPQMRSELEGFFGAPIVDMYSLTEAGMLGLRTPQSPGFLSYDFPFIVKVLDEKLRPLPPGHSGLIAVTALEEYRMPFIRYITGDTGRIAVEPEGPWLRLEALEGRLNELLSLKDGRSLHPYQLAEMMTYYAVPRFQIVQESLERVLFRTETAMEPALQAEIAAAIRRVMEDSRLEIAFEQARFDPSRKFQPIVSKIPNRYTQALL